MGFRSRALTFGKLYLPPQASKRRGLEKVIRDSLLDQGYEEIIPPLLVDAETGIPAIDRLPKEQGVRLIGKNGNLMALRTDFTVSIAHVVTSFQIPHRPPLRLFYSGSVFRTPIGADAIEEFYQAGIEVVGSKDAGTDVEVLLAACKALSAAGLKNYKIGVGYADLLQGILENAGATNEEQKAIYDALAKRNYVDYANLLDSCDLPYECKNTLSSLPSLRGAKDLLDGLPENVLGARGRKSLSSLKTIFEEVGEAGLEDMIYVDLSLARAFDYYTGIVFEGYVQGTGQPILGGGRYDKMYRSFGVDIPAIGFALDMDKILSASDKDMGI